MQGVTYAGVDSTYGMAIDLMNKKELDILCLQEAGNLLRIRGGWIPEGEIHYRDTNLGSHSRSKGIIREFYLGWKDFSRCSMAIFVRYSPYLPMHMPLPLIDVYYPQQHDQVRPLMGLDWGDFAIYNLHAPSGDTPLAQAILNQFIYYISIRRLGREKPFILTGDFNIPAPVLNMAQIQAIMPDVIMHCPEYRTQTSGNILDYCIVSNRIEIRNMERSQNQAGSDHLYVTYIAHI